MYDEFVQKIEFNISRVRQPWEPPLRLDNLRILDVASYIASERELEHGIHKKYHNLRTWVYPIIYGTGFVTGFDMNGDGLINSADTTPGKAYCNSIEIEDGALLEIQVTNGAELEILQ